MAKWVYKFEEGSAAMRNLLGGKGCNLAEMTNLGMPIPQGFTVTTEACTDYYNSGKQITKEIQDQIFEALTWLEGVNGKKFGDTEDPLLVSVRSGARASMPGMMDTILNLGLNDVAVEGFAKKTGNPRFAYDSYRRFIQMYSDVVMEVPKSYFEKIIGESQDAWRRVIVRAVEAGIPTPVFSSSLAYYDGLRSKRLPTALTQSQRDFFGAHTYGRVDKPGVFHTLWAEEGKPEIEA